MGWKQLHVMQEHDHRVNGIDWAPKTNRIVTCAADKNAYVWTQGEDGKWNPAFVLVRLNRAATCVKWSPLGTFDYLLISYSHFLNRTTLLKFVFNLYPFKYF